MTQPFFSAGSQKKQASGPQKWSVGQKLWDTMVYHKSLESLNKYLSKTMHDTKTGSNDSMYQALRRPESVLSPEAFASDLDARNSELLNADAHRVLGSGRCRGKPASGHRGLGAARGAAPKGQGDVESALREA